MGDIAKKVLILSLISLLFGCSSGRKTIHATFVDRIDYPQNSDQFQQALAFYNAGEYQSAETSFGKLLETDPANWQANYYLGLINLHNKSYPQSEEYLFKALQFVDQTKENRAAVYFALGRLYEHQEKLAPAKLNYLTAFRLNPTSEPIQKAVERYQLISKLK